jgi:hypothetical protein
MSKNMTAFQFAYQANIEQYSEILQTDLTAQERAFFERRLAEEQAAFRKFLGYTASILGAKGEIDTNKTSEGRAIDLDQCSVPRLN